MSVLPAKTLYLIIGGGIAGVSASEAIHHLDSDAKITLISDEHCLPYFRMSLTRYLAGDIERDKLDLHSQGWYLENHIDIIKDAHVDSLDLDKKLVHLSDGREFAFDKLVLANGASPFVPPIPGHELEGVMTLRSLEDAQVVLEKCETPMNIVCIGGGLLGLEIAGAIARHKAKVTVLEALDWLLPRQLGEEAARILQKEIEKLGIRVIVPAKIKQISGDDKLNSVELEDGTVISADLVLISAGVRNNISLAKEAGLEVNRGVIVDHHMQTSHPDVFAAGDVTEFQGVSYGLWIPAKKQGDVAGRNAAGEPARYNAEPPSAKLKVLGLDLFSIGQFAPSLSGDRLVTWQDDGKYISLMLREGKLVGANLLGKTGMEQKVKKAVENGQAFEVFQSENAGYQFS